MIKIAVDLQGADREPTVLADGALRAVAENDDLSVYLCGDGRMLYEYLKGKDYRGDRIFVVDAPETITNGEDPAEAFRTKKNSSVVGAFELCRSDPEISALVTCGATGAVFVSSVMMLGRIIPASPMLLCELRRSDGSPFCIVDCGANVDCRAEKLVDFARMGTAYMKARGVAAPKVGLLSNGTEDGKGNAAVKKANGLMRNSGLTFIGNVEGSHILDGEADVISCEGFSGNILLKTIEGTAKAVVGEWRELSRTLPAEIRNQTGKLADILYERYDYNAQGGAVLLGLDIPVVKGHGSADAHTVYRITEMAYELAKNRITDRIRTEFSHQR